MASRTSQWRGIKPNFMDLEEVQLHINWEDVSCPICLDFPHNGVLLHCSSYEKGCRPIMCDTGRTHSNCFDRFRSAYGIAGVAKSFPTTDGSSGERIRTISPSPNCRPACPLCRGEVKGWVVIEEVQTRLNMKGRCCEERHCSYVGNFAELQNHAKLKHPNSRPSEIDPAHRLDWENFQQSSEIIDVLSTIHAEVPNGVVMGDYVVEYGDDGTGDEYEDFHRGRRGRWWTSCMLYKVFYNFRASRNRRRSQARERRGGSHRSRSDASSLDEGSGSADSTEYRFDETVHGFVRAGGSGSGAAASVEINQSSS